MEKIELVIGIIVGLITIAGVIWGLGAKVIKKLSEPLDEVKMQVDEILEKVTHNGNADRYLLKYRIEKLCFGIFDKCKRTGCAEVDKDLLTTINNMYEEYKYFGGNSTVDKLIERVNKLYIVE